jgi:hypothetical protein
VVLLSRLLQTRQLLSLPNVPTYEWTDSTITLAWLKLHPSGTLMSRTESPEVQISSSNITWHHVSSKENPADCASRRLSASELSTHDLWWNGSPWLKRASTIYYYRPKRDSAMLADAATAEEISAEVRKTTSYTIHHVDCASV